MKAQPFRMHCLCALLLVGLATHAALAATHSSVAVYPGATHAQPADGESGGGHDPASCSFCRIAPAFEHALSAPPLCLPIGVEVIRDRIDALPAPRPQRPWSSAVSRAPPSAPGF